MTWGTTASDQIWNNTVPAEKESSNLQFSKIIEWAPHRRKSNKACWLQYIEKEEKSVNELRWPIFTV